MSNTQLRLRRGTTAEHANFTGAQGELTVDTDKNALVLHDGATQGGKNLSEITATGSTTARSLEDRFAEIVRPEDYGAVGDWDDATQTGTDDTTAIQNALADAVADNKTLVLSKNYYITASLNSTEQIVKIEGTGRVFTTGFVTDQDIEVLKVKGDCKLINFEITSISSTKTKAAITTSLTGLQLAYANFKALNIYGFKYGIYARYSLWTNFEDILIKNCTAGIVLSGNDNQSNFYQPQGGWNSWSNGFFHNANTFNNILVEGGELGMFICGSNNAFVNFTAQGQSTDGTSNSVLPSGQQGTGVWVSGRVDSSAQKSRNMVFNSLYVEYTKNPVYLFNADASIDGLFVQGGSSSAKFPYVLRADSSSCRIVNSWGQDWFDYAIKFEETLSRSTVKGFVPGTLTVPYRVDGNGYYRSAEEIAQRRYTFGKDGGGSGTTYTLDNEALGNYENLLITATGIEDGYIHRHGAWIISRSGGGLTAITELQAMGNVVLDLNSYKPRFTINSNLTYSMRAMVQDTAHNTFEPSDTITIV